MISIEYYSEEIPGLPLASLVSSLPLLISEESHALGNITLVFCTDDELLELNKEYLSHDYYTDIITFAHHTETDKTISGEMYISIDRVKSNASAYGVSFIAELRRVMVHGVLHLCGYHDKTEEETARMRMEENRLLVLLD